MRQKHSIAEGDQVGLNTWQDEISKLHEYIDKKLDLVKAAYDTYTAQRNTHAMWTHFSTNVAGSIIAYLKQDGCEIQGHEYKLYGAHRIVEKPVFQKMKIDTSTQQLQQQIQHDQAQHLLKQHRRAKHILHILHKINVQPTNFHSCKTDVVKRLGTFVDEIREDDGIKSNLKTTIFQIQND
eukprot:12408551-Karenia_brevis.AAC.1